MRTRLSLCNRCFLLAGVVFARRDEFPGDVGARIGREADSGGGRAAPRRQHALCERTGRGVPGDASGGGCPLPGLRISRDHSALQRVPQPRYRRRVCWTVGNVSPRATSPRCHARRSCLPHWLQVRRLGVCRSRLRPCRIWTVCYVEFVLQRRLRLFRRRVCQRFRASSSCDRDGSSSRWLPPLLRQAASAARVRERVSRGGYSIPIAEGRPSFAA